MLSKKDLLSAVLGLSITAVPAGAIAANHFQRSPETPRSSAWQITPHSPILLADEDEHEEHQEHHHHHRWHRDDDRRPAEGRYHDDDDYYWGGRNRYEYPPSYFSEPVPNGWDAPRRQAFLMHKRDTAVMLRNRMRARGDTDAVHRLDGVISQLNREMR